MRRPTLLMATLGVLAACALVGWWVLAPPAPLREAARIVEIPAHEGVREIAARLHREGVIRSPVGFIGLSLIHGKARRLRAGEYEVRQGATSLEVLELLESGRVRQHGVLHPEGATLEELAGVLGRMGLADPAAIVRVATDPSLLTTLGVAGPSLEGYLFPDTYQLTKGMRPEEILTLMVQRLRAKVTPSIAGRAGERGLTLHELLTLASIIEREAVVPDERRLISAVFWNRLGRDMPLQADPTVQYAVGRGREALTRADLQTDHPYNTYRRPGLPPGPIASPGLPAIEAALDPAPVDFLYFVAMDNRRHHFSLTVEEHNAAVARYRVARPSPRGGVDGPPARTAPAEATPGQR
jgi:UPF0755 protein